MSKEQPKKDDSTGEWRARTGVHATVDTGLLRSLDGNSELGNPQPEKAGEDPYNRTVPPLDTTAKTRRRSLDDMRRLSEMIKADKPAK
jgi:hypothetical protein